MKIRMDLKNAYDIEIGSKIIEKLNLFLQENYKNSKILIISDDLVYKIHKEKRAYNKKICKLTNDLLRVHKMFINS